MALYADGFVCVDGSLGRYCVERGCLSDSDCRDEYGSDSWCETWGAEGGRCTVPDPPKYVPPFRSICSVSAGRPPAIRAPLGAPPLLLLLAGLLLGSRRRLRGQRRAEQGSVRP